MNRMEQPARRRITELAKPFFVFAAYIIITALFNSGALDFHHFISFLSSILPAFDWSYLLPLIFSDYLMHFVVIVLLILRLTYNISFAEMGFRRPFTMKNLFLFLANLLIVSAVLCYTYFRYPVRVDWPTILFNCFFQLFCVAFMEEGIFRGYLSRKLILLFSDSTYLPVPIILSGLLFALAHLSANNLAFVLGIAWLFGIYSAALYFVTDNLWACIIIHGTYNLLSYVVVPEEPVPFQLFYLLLAVVYLIIESVLRWKKKKSTMQTPDPSQNES